MVPKTDPAASVAKSIAATDGRSSEHSTVKVAPSAMSSVVTDAVRTICASSGAKSPSAACLIRYNTAAASLGV